jgi:hypothetical protein
MQTGALEAAHAAMHDPLPTGSQTVTLFVRDFGRPSRHPGAEALGPKRNQRQPCTLCLQRNPDDDALYGATSVRVQDAVRRRPCD